MSAPRSAALVLYTRRGCHLCDDAREMLTGLLRDRAASGASVPDMREVDIESDADLLRRHLETIPVLAAGGAELPLAMRPDAVRRFLAEHLDGLAGAPPLDRGT